MCIERLYDLSKEFSGKDATKDEIDKTYNKLLNHCEGIVNLGFDIKLFPAKEQNSFLIEILNLKESDKDFLSTKTSDKKFPNRKIIDNLQKDNMDLDKEPLIDFFIKKGVENKSFIPNLSPFKDILPIDVENKTMIKGSIRYSENLNKERYENPYTCILDYANSVDIELNQLEEIGIRNLKHEILATDLIVEGFNYLFLQTIIYLIIKNPNLNKVQRVKCLSYIEEVLEKQNLDDCGELKYENIYNSFAIYLYQVRKRNEMVNYIDVITALEKEMLEDKKGLYSNVQDKYNCNKRWIKDIKTKTELMDIILEGKSEKVERFNEKAEKCKKAIADLRNIAGRDLCEEYLQHFKVVYREVFLSKVKSNEKDGKNANTIVREMTKEENTKLFLKYIDSIFLREKISRGFFREDGLIEEYRIKNKIQKHLYTILLKIYKNLDIKYQRKGIKELFETISKEMLLILEEIDEALEGQI